MEFKVRAIDEQPSTYLPSSSSISYFTEQALRAGYRSNDFVRADDLFRNPSNVREAIQRQIEKERIREEIIAAEITRKHLLEAEVRREILMEREMGLRRGNGLSFLSPASASSSMWFEPRLSILHRSEGRSLEERLALSLEERLSYSSRREIGGLEMVPFQRKVEPKISEIVEPKISEIIPFQRKVEPKISEIPFQRKVEPKISEIKPLSEVSKEKIIFLAKPNGNLSGAKRKAETPPAAGASELPSVGPKKKPKEEWSCALCQVSATNEQGLNEHLQGKKHKARETNLIAQRTGKNFTIGLFPKRTNKPTPTPNTEQGKKKGKESLQFNKTRETFLQKKSNTEGIESEIPNGEAVQKMQKNKDFKKKKFKFWCEMCQIGAYSEKVMETHRKGKKHVGRLQELNQNGESDAGAQMAQTIQNVKEAELVAQDEEKETLVAKDEDKETLVAKDEEKETSENVGLADGVEARKCQAAVGVALAD